MVSSVGEEMLSLLSAAYVNRLFSRLHRTCTHMDRMYPLGSGPEDCFQHQVDQVPAVFRTDSEVTRDRYQRAGEVGLSGGRRLRQ